MTTLPRAGFARSCDAPGSDCGATWPGANATWPAIVEIDHFLGRGLRFVNARVVRGGGSDHDAVLAGAVVAP